MEPGRFRPLLEGLVYVPLKKYDDELHSEIARILVQNHARPRETRLGMSKAEAGYSLGYRAKLIYKAALHVLQETGAAPQLWLVDEARSAVRELIEAQPSRILEALRSRFGDDADSAAESLASASSDHARNFESQVELFIRALPQPTRPTVNRQGNTFNIHAPVGAIQTGERATANITQSTVLPEVLGALQRIAVHFESVDGDEAQEVVTLIHEMQTEIGSTRPNRLKVAGVASALAGVVQTVADLQPAFATIRVFLQSLGINIP